MTCVFSILGSSAGRVQARSSAFSGPLGTVSRSYRSGRPTRASFILVEPRRNRVRRQSPYRSRSVQSSRLGKRSAPTRHLRPSCSSPSVVGNGRDRRFHVGERTSSNGGYGLLLGNSVFPIALSPSR